jgi:hypothetical protein
VGGERLDDGRLVSRRIDERTGDRACRRSTSASGRLIGDTSRSRALRERSCARTTRRVCEVRGLRTGRGYEIISMASLSGNPELARQLEEFGNSDEDSSLEDARELRPLVLVMISKIIERYGRENRGLGGDH